MGYNELIQILKDCYFKVRKDFTPGYLESVYQNAMLIQLREAGLFLEKEKRLPLEYHGEIIGDFRADILVENEIILELIAVTSIHEMHHAQVVNYLKVTGKDFGVLMNFGSEKYFFIPKFRTMELLNRYS